MKNILKILTVFTILTLIITTGCKITLVMPADQPATTQTSEPLVGKWEMTRLSIAPEVPVPDIILNQVIAQKATWKISRVNGKLTIDYGGRDTWYNPMGINIQQKPTQVTESPDKRSCTFKSGGIIQIPGLPTILSSAINANVQNITVDFDDTVTINIPEENDYRSGEDLRTYKRAVRSAERGKYRPAVRMFLDVLNVMPAHIDAPEGHGPRDQSCR